MNQTINPREGQHCTISMYLHFKVPMNLSLIDVLGVGKGTGSFDYTSNVTLELEYGTQITYPQNSVQFSQVSGRCHPENDPTQWDGDESGLPSGVSMR